MPWIPHKCALCSTEETVRYVAKLRDYYCSECLKNYPLKINACVYEPIEKTGRRIVHNHRGEIIRIEDF
jgi:hypothetical protein